MAEKNRKEAAPSGAFSDKGENTPVKLLFSLVFFVSPLIFFTNLTRNPYYFQIALLNISLALLFFYWFFRSYLDGVFVFQKSPLYPVVAPMLFFFALSSVISFFGHESFFRPSMASEFKRIWMFTLVNCMVPFFLAGQIGFEEKENPDYYKYLIIIFFWGALWAFFPFLKNENLSSGLFFKFWDFYGGLLWLGGLLVCLSCLKKINHENLLKIAMLAGCVASIYGILQYFGFEFIWAKLINPYGRRSVSTFGNPNFVSSYVLMLIPPALYYFALTANTAGKIFYSVTIVSSIGMILASLTRSSLLGLVAASAFMFSFRTSRAFFGVKGRIPKKTALTILALLLLWPDHNLKPFSYGALMRMTEGVSGTISGLTLDLKRDEIYPSFHQRLLIWSSAAAMFSNNPVTGNGWGSFELFYPFYQGEIIKKHPSVANLRTHANNSHNEIMETLSQTGLLGLGSFLFFFFCLYYFSLRYIRSAPPEKAVFVIAILAGITGMLVDNMLNVSVHFAVPGFLFWWFVGLTAKKISESDPEYSSIHLSPASGRVLLGTAFLAVFFAVHYWVGQFMREVYYFDGFKYMRKNDFQLAVENLKKAYAWNPREVNTDYELANAYVRSGDLDKSLWAYSEALKSNAGYDEIYFNLAVIQKKNGLEEKAIENLRTSAAINPFNKLAYQGLVEIYMKNPRIRAAEAVRDMAEGIKVFPYDPNFYNLAGYFSVAESDYKQAVKFYAGALEIKPGEEMFRRNLEGALRAAGEKKNETLDFSDFYKKTEALMVSSPQAALSVLGEGEKKYGNRLMFRYLKAKTLFSLGRIQEARKGLEEIVGERDDFNEARYGLAALCEKEKDTVCARKNWEIFLEYEPENEKIRQRLSAI